MLHGRVALVAGGTGMVGSAVCRRLAADGATVVANGRDAAKLEQLKASLAADGLAIELAPADVLDESALAGVVDRILERHGQVDVMVHAIGGGGAIGRFEELPLEGWRRAIELNLTSAFACAHACLGHMRRQRFGRLMFMGSGAYAGAIGLAPYAAAKAGLVGLVKTLALEGGPDGVTANVLMLGHVASPRWSERPPEFVAALMAQVPLGRFIPPEEIAGAVAFLASQDASTISGQVLHLTGGSDWVGPTIDLSALRRG